MVNLELSKEEIHFLYQLLEYKLAEDAPGGKILDSILDKLKKNMIKHKISSEYKDYATNNCY